MGGTTNGAVNNCQCYGNLKAVGLEGKVGMIMGQARADATKAANCKVGGSLVLKQNQGESSFDDETGETIPGEIEDVVTTLNGNNWFQYIYNAAVEKSVAEDDGCSLLSEKPAVPVYTYTPAAN